MRRVDLDCCDPGDPGADGVDGAPMFLGVQRLNRAIRP
jgi:hypothetical protein